ncbi:MAG: branched-chain amino acid aminotransferase [Rikenellaceae bacterium]
METLDWANLGFAYRKTPYNVRCTSKNGKWGALEVSSDEYIPIHMAASCLHYGQEAFEGLKAQRGRDGRIRLFRVADNARRMITSAEQVMMDQPPVELFVEAVNKAVSMNKDLVPPFGSGASLYIRPLLIGTGAQVGVKPCSEYMLVVFVMPVGPYFKGGETQISGVVMRDFDRAAPRGTGHVKVGGNYAASMLSGEMAHGKGYDTVIYLDPATKTTIEEAGAANFFAIKNNTYITPMSHSILPSITNKSLEQIAKDLGMKVERRAVSLTECATFEEAGACGTAAVVTSIGKIDDLEKGVTYTFGKGVVAKKLRERMVAIQQGEAEDIHGWVSIVE